MKKGNYKINVAKEKHDKKFMKTLKKEIDVLKFKVDHPKTYNFQNTAVRNLKISLKGLQFIAPFVLCAGIGVGVCKISGLGYPFVSDQLKETKRTMKEMDSLGNIRIEEQYEKIANTVNLLEYCTSWQSDNLGNYYRDVEVYTIGELTEKEIDDIISGAKSDIKSILGEPVRTKREIKNKLTEEESKQKNYIKAIMYFEDENDYIMVKTGFGHEVLTACVFVAVVAFSSLIPGSIYDFKHYNFISEMEKIKYEYVIEDSETIKKKLKIKKENYERLSK